MLSQDDMASLTKLTIRVGFLFCFIFCFVFGASKDLLARGTVLFGGNLVNVYTQTARLFLSSVVW